METDNWYGITVLYQPPEADETIFDLVAIHGLNGHAFKTWTHKQTKIMWLKDLLPETLPNVRIMTYGYNASFYNFTGHQDLRHIAMKLLSELVDLRKSQKERRRPLVFICHSLGGIVAKKALLIGCPSEQAVVQSATYGILFMATPHCGSSLANIGLVLSKIAGACSPITSPRWLLGSLQKDSKVLFEITSDFIAKLTSLQIVSLFEMELTSMGLFKKLVVDKNSAVLNVPGEVVIGQYANHRSIARFSSADDRTFRPIQSRLEQFMNDIQDAWRIKSTPEDTSDKRRPGSEPDPLFVVPYAQCAIFTGRDTLLTAMETYFWERENPEQQLTYAISGLGGCGKTQTALRYAVRNRFKYKSGVLFFNATSQTTLAADFARVCDLLHLGGPSDKVESLKQWLCKKANRQWLLIFDNADDLASVNLAKHFPAATWGHIIITSRDQYIVNVVASAGEVLLPLSVEDSLTVLLSRASISNPSESEREDAIEIVNLLGCLPLALDQAGAFIRRRYKSLHDYRRLLESKREEVFRASPNILDNEKSIASVWELNLQRIEKDAPRAWELLVLLSFLEPANIPEILLRRASAPKTIWGRDGEKEQVSPEANGLDPVLVTLLGDEMQLDDAVDQLASFSLMQWNQSVGRYGRSLSIHPLVQHCVTHRVDHWQRDKWRAQAVLLVAHAFPFDVYTDQHFGNIGRMLFPHVVRVLNEFEKLDNNHVGWASMVTGMRYLLLSSSRFHTGPWKRRAIALARELLHEETDPFLNAWTASRESQLLRWADDREASSEALEQHIKKIVLPGDDDGPVDPRYNAQRGELVLSYVENLLKASEFQRAETVVRQWSPANPDAPSAMESLISRKLQVLLARILKLQRRFAEALSILERLLYQLSDSEYFASTGWQMSMFTNLSEIYCETGKPRSAAKVLRRELQVIRSQGWEEMSSGRRLQLSLAETLLLRGRFDLAEPCLLKLLALYEGDMDPGYHQATKHFRTWTMLARISHHRERWEEARVRWNGALAVLENHRGFTYGISMCSLAQVLFRLRKVEEAREALEQGRESLASDGRLYHALGTYWLDYVMTDLGTTGPSPIISDPEEMVVDDEEDLIGQMATGNEK